MTLKQTIMIKGKKMILFIIVLLALIATFASKSLVRNDSKEVGAFPIIPPLDKPTDRELSSAMERFYDQWDGASGEANELFSNFKYTPLKGFKDGAGISRRDPSKVLKIDGKYYVWYTYRNTGTEPVGRAKATATIPSADWDLCDIWYATSDDGITWEEQGAAVVRPPKGNPG